VAEHAPALRARVEPGVEARLRLAADGNRAQQPHGVVGAGLPALDVRVVGHRAFHDVVACQGHALRHRAAQAAQHFELAVVAAERARGAHRARRGRQRRAERGCEVLGRRRQARAGGGQARAHDVVHGDEAFPAGAVDRGEIDAEPSGELACRGNSAQPRGAAATPRPAPRGRCRELFVAHGHVAHHGAGGGGGGFQRRPGAGAAGEIHQRRADGDGVTRFAMQRDDAAGMRRGHLDHGLRRLHRHQRIVDLHGIADGHVPAHDLGLLKAFAEIGKVEPGARHRGSLRQAWIVSRMPSAMRATLGM
jgi:hypothetical protein